MLRHVRYLNSSKKNTLYGPLPPKNIAEINPWYTVHVELIGTYSNYIRQHHLVGAIIKNNGSLN